MRNGRNLREPNRFMPGNRMEKAYTNVLRKAIWDSPCNKDDHEDYIN